MSKSAKAPKNWAANVEYIRDLRFAKQSLVDFLNINSAQLQYSQTDANAMERLSISKFYETSGSSAFNSGATSKSKSKSQSQSQSQPKASPGFGSNPLNTIKIESLLDKPAHPAYPYSGLFTTKDLKPGQLITPYYGHVTSGDDTDPTSDYCLRLGELSVDANYLGNEGRFVNDYRGIMEKPNAEFREFVNTDLNRVEMGIFVVKSKAMPRGIRKKTEITVSYGKAFWRSRNLLRESINPS